MVRPPKTQTFPTFFYAARAGVEHVAPGRLSASPWPTAGACHMRLKNEKDPPAMVNGRWVFCNTRGALAERPVGCRCPNAAHFRVSRPVDAGQVSARLV